MEAIMVRTLFCRLVGVVVICGCSGKQPPPPPTASTDAAPQQQPQAAAPVSKTPAVTSTTTAPAAPSAPAPVSSRFRDLVGRYLESDGHSGWRTSEKAATELEKLSPDEIAQLWPLLKDSQVEVRRGAAVFLLSQFNPDGADHRTAFLTLLDDHDPMIRARSLDAVRQFSRDDQMAALPRLSTMLNAA